MQGIIESISETDHSILLFIQENLRFDGLTPVMQLLSKSVNIGAFWVLLGIALLCFKKTRMVGAAVLSSLVVGLFVNNVIVKNAVARARPYDTYNDLITLIKKPRDTSFASGHTTASFAAAGILVRFLNRPLSAAVICYAVLVGYSRLYLGVHYPSDVICGCLIGISGSIAVYYFYSRRFDLDEYKMKKLRRNE